MGCGNYLISRWSDRSDPVTVVPAENIERAFSRLVHAAVMGQTDVISRLLASRPELATRHSAVGATRQHAAEFFFDEAAHYLFAGDTVLHMAAAAFQRSAAELLVRSGAVCRARNRLAPSHCITLRTPTDGSRRPNVTRSST